MHDRLAIWRLDPAPAGGSQLVGSQHELPVVSPGGMQPPRTPATGGLLPAFAHGARTPMSASSFAGASFAPSTVKRCGRSRGACKGLAWLAAALLALHVVGSRVTARRPAAPLLLNPCAHRSSIRTPDGYLSPDVFNPAPRATGPGGLPAHLLAPAATTRAAAGLLLPGPDPAAVFKLIARHVLPGMAAPPSSGHLVTDAEGAPLLAVVCPGLGGGTVLAFHLPFRCARRRGAARSARLATGRACAFLMATSDRRHRRASPLRALARSPGAAPPPVPATLAFSLPALAAAALHATRAPSDASHCGHLVDLLLLTPTRELVLHRGAWPLVRVQLQGLGRALAAAPRPMSQLQGRRSPAEQGVDDGADGGGDDMAVSPCGSSGGGVVAASPGASPGAAGAFGAGAPAPAGLEVAAGSAFSVVYADGRAVRARLRLRWLDGLPSLALAALREVLPPRRYHALLACCLARAGACCGELPGEWGAIEGALLAWARDARHLEAFKPAEPASPAQAQPGTPLGGDALPAGTPVAGLIRREAPAGARAQLQHAGLHDLAPGFAPTPAGASPGSMDMDLATPDSALAGAPPQTPLWWGVPAAGAAGAPLRTPHTLSRAGRAAAAAAAQQQQEAAAGSQDGGGDDTEMVTPITDAAPAAPGRGLALSTPGSDMALATPGSGAATPTLRLPQATPAAPHAAATPCSDMAVATPGSDMALATPTMRIADATPGLAVTPTLRLADASPGSSMAQATPASGMSLVTPTMRLEQPAATPATTLVAGAQQQPQPQQPQPQQPQRQPQQPQQPQQQQQRQPAAAPAQGPAAWAQLRRSLPMADLAARFPWAAAALQHTAALEERQPLPQEEPGTPLSAERRGEHRRELCLALGALHSLYEDAKLDCLRRPLLPLLARTCAALAARLGAGEYEEAYERDLGPWALAGAQRAAAPSADGGGAGAGAGGGDSVDAPPPASVLPLLARLLAGEEPAPGELPLLAERGSACVAATRRVVECYRVLGRVSARASALLSSAAVACAAPAVGAAAGGAGGLGWPWLRSGEAFAVAAELRQLLLGGSQELVLLMVEQGWDPLSLERLPLGVALPLKEALSKCRNYPPSGVRARGERGGGRGEGRETAA
jgi:hypothetical protein